MTRTTSTTTPSIQITLSSFRLQRTSTRTSFARDSNLGHLRLRITLPNARPETIKSSTQAITSDLDTITFPDFTQVWYESLKLANDDNAENSTERSNDQDELRRRLSARGLEVKVVGRMASDRRVSIWNRLRGKSERLLGQCTVDLWTATTGPVHHNICLKNLQGVCTQFRLEFQLNIVVKRAVIFRFRDVRVDLANWSCRKNVDGNAATSSTDSVVVGDDDDYRTSKEGNGYPEPYVVVSFVGSGKPTVISQEKLVPTCKPRWSYLPALEVPALSVADLVAGHVLVKVHDARNHNRLMTSFKVNMHSYWGCALSQGREMRVRVSPENSLETFTAFLAVENAPLLCQMRGGVHSDEGITDGRPLVFGVPLPMSRRRDDTVWGTRMPVLQGWIELLDSYGYVYYHNVASRLNSWLEPGEADMVEGNAWDTFFRTLSDGSETWIHPCARQLQRLTLTSVSDRSLRLVPASDGDVSTRERGSAVASAMSSLTQCRQNALTLDLATPSSSAVKSRRQFPKLVDETGILTEMRWTSLDDVFSRRVFPGVGTEGHSLSTIDNGHTLLKFGGAGVGGTKNNDLYAFNTREMLWRPIRASGVAPTPRMAHGAATFCDGSRVLIFGGGSRQGRLNDLHVLDTECWNWSTVLPVSRVAPERRARLGMTAMPNGTSAVLFGGREGYRYLGDRYYNDVWVFDAYRTEWLNIKPTGAKLGPSPRSGSVVEMINGRQMFVHAGYDDGDRFYGDTWLLDTISWSWQQVPYPKEPHRPIPREGHASTVLGDTVFIYGGDRENGGYLSDVHMFDSGTLRWAGEPVTTGSSPGGRCGAAMAPVDSQRILLVGGDNGYRMVSETHTLDTVYTAKAQVKEVIDRVQREGPHASSCIICLDGPVEAVFLWCGHFVCCKSCASRVKKCCPLCRRWISKVSLVPP